MILMWDIYIQKMIRKFKIVITGDRRVGKTSFIHRLRGNQKLWPACGCTSHRLTDHLLDFSLVPDSENSISRIRFLSNNEKIIFECYESTTEDNFIDAKGVIIMFDVTSKSSYLYAKALCDKVKYISGKDIPIVVCGNKVDIKERVVDWYDNNDFEGVKYYDISAKSFYNCTQPFFYLARTLLGNQDLVESSPCDSIVNIENPIETESTDKEVHNPDEAIFDEANDKEVNKLTDKEASQKNLCESQNTATANDSAGCTLM